MKELEPEREILHRARSILRARRTGGVIGALIALLVSQHLGATDLESFSSIGVSFLGTTMFVCFVEEKLGLL